MKYLFFDLECSNCFNNIGKIVEFGFVITDENFHILRMNEFVMSPGKGNGNRFSLKGRNGQKDLQLAYEYEYYYQQEEFPYFYDKIKAILEDPNTLVFAWSSENDILHLYHTCLRYKKDPIKYSCYDVQKIAMKYLNIENQVALEKACDLILGRGATIGLQEHLSRDDARMTMMILSKLTSLKGQQASDILKESEFAKDDANKLSQSVDLKKEKVKEKKNKYNEYRKASKEGYRKIKDPNFKGNKYNLSILLRKRVSDLKPILNKIKSLHGVIVDSIKISDYLVVLDEFNLEELKEKHGDTFKGQYILLSDLMNNSKNQ